MLSVPLSSSVSSGLSLESRIHEPEKKRGRGKKGKGDTVILTITEILYQVPGTTSEVWFLTFFGRKRTRFEDQDTNLFNFGGKRHEFVL